MIYTTLLSLFALIPFTLSAPNGPGRGDYGHYGGKGKGHGSSCPQNTCLATSLHDPSWTLSLEYHAFWYFTTPAHQNSWGTVTFNLTNTAVGATIHCQADSSRLSDFFYGDQWYTCVPSPAVASIPETTFRFVSHSRFDLNQTWTCDESLKQPKQKPVKFTALATTDLDMKCTDVSWTNPNWTPGTGAFYTTRDVKCDPVKLTLKPYEEQVIF